MWSCSTGTHSHFWSVLPYSPSRVSDCKWQLKYADEIKLTIQCHSHHSVDEGTKEVPWCTIRSHACGCHSFRRSRCCRIHGLRIGYPDCRSCQSTSGRQVRPGSPVLVYVLTSSSRYRYTITDHQTRSRSCCPSHFSSSQLSESWRTVYSSDQARTT